MFLLLNKLPSLQSLLLCQSTAKTERSKLTRVTTTTTKSKSSFQARKHEKIWERKTSQKKYIASQLKRTHTKRARKDKIEIVFRK